MSLSKVVLINPVLLLDNNFQINLTESGFDEFQYIMCKSPYEKRKNNQIQLQV